METLKKHSNTFILLLLLVGIFMFLFGVRTVSAAVIYCAPPDDAKVCGYTVSYNMSGSCSMSGGDKDGANRILGGQVCSIGGSDVGGYYMIGTGEPTASTPIYPYSSPTPPGWTYGKSGALKSSIPLGEFQDDSYYIHRFFGGPVSVNLPQADDESILNVGSNYVYWTGCSCNIKSVWKSDCPSNTFMGSTNFSANPGDSIVFNVKNLCRPNAGFGTWGAGSASVSLGEVTTCYTPIYQQYIGGFQVVREYHPTAPGVCTPHVSCYINSLDASNLNPPYNTSVALNFTVSGSEPNWIISTSTFGTAVPGGAGSGAVGSYTTPNLTAPTTYTVACSADRTRYRAVTIWVEPPPDPPVAKTLIADPMTVSAGGTSVITWECERSTSGIVNPPGWAGLSGSQTTPPLFFTTTYTLTCSKPGLPPATRSVTVNTTVPVGDQYLNVTKTGTGSGTVTSIPSGINCGSDCAENYTSGASVTLTASAAAGSQFAGWTGTGGCSGTAASCTVTMDRTRYVIATFNIATGPTATITSTPSCAGPCNVAVSWTSQNVANPPNVVRIYKNGTFLWNQTANTPGSETDWNAPVGAYQYCIRAVKADWTETANLACSNTVVTAAGCAYSISPASASYGAAAASGSFSMTTGGTCPWTAVSSNPWITVTGGSSGTGNGTVSYSVAANAGAARTGTISAGGRTFTVSQAGMSGGAPTCTLSAFPSSGPAPLSGTLMWSTTNNPTLCTASGGWSGSKSATGGSQSYGPISANTTYGLICSNISGSGSCSVTVGISGPSPLSCNPQWQNVNTGQPANLSVSGGIPPYRWVSDGSPSSGTGSTFSTTYSTNGIKLVSVLDSISALSSCTVQVGPPTSGTDLKATYGSFYFSGAWFDSIETSSTINSVFASISLPSMGWYRIRLWRDASSTTTDYLTLPAPAFTATIFYLGSPLNMGSLPGFAYNTPGDYYLKGIFSSTDAPGNETGSHYQDIVPIRILGAPPPASYNLAVSKSGAGSGTVTSNPSGISCGSTCSASFSSGASVTLTAAPSAGSQFAGWSGAGCSGTGTCTVTMNANQAVTATFNVAPPPATLSVNLSASPLGGNAPLQTTLSADVSGTAAGTINYTFWWNCSSGSTNVAAVTAACGDPDGAAGNANGAKFNDVSDDPKSVSHTYATAGTYTVKVIAERGTAPATEDRIAVTVSSATHLECQNNACVPVAGAGINRCTTNASCGQGGAVFHGVCDALQRACVNVAGPGTSTCKIDADCGVARQTRLECQNSACVIRSGTGSDTCAKIGRGCQSGWIEIPPQ